MGEKKRFWSVETNNPIEKTVDTLFRGLSMIAILAVIVAMVITVLDVCMRTFANQSLKGVLEWTQFLMVIVCYCAMPWVTWQFGHIKVDIVTSKLPASVEKWFMVVDKLLMAAFSGYMSVMIWKQGLMVKKMHSVGAITRVSLYPFYYLISIMMGICVIAMIVNFLSLLMTGKEKMR